MPRKRKRNAGLGLHHCKKAAKITDDPNRVKPFGRPKKFEHPTRSPPKQKKREKNDETEARRRGDDDDNSNFSSESDSGEIAEMEEIETEEIETVVMKADDEDDEKKEKLFDEVDRRVTIAYLFVNKYKGLENLKDGRPMDNWRGRGGVIGKIRKDMGKK